MNKLTNPKVKTSNKKKIIGIVTTIALTILLIPIIVISSKTIKNDDQISSTQTERRFGGNKTMPLTSLYGPFFQWIYYNENMKKMTTFDNVTFYWEHGLNGFSIGGFRIFTLLDRWPDYVSFNIKDDLDTQQLDEIDVNALIRIYQEITVKHNAETGKWIFDDVSYETRTEANKLANLLRWNLWIAKDDPKTVDKNQK